MKTIIDQNNDHQAKQAIKNALNSAITTMPLETFTPELLAAVIHNAADITFAQNELNEARYHRAQIGKDLLKQLGQI